MDKDARDRSKTADLKAVAPGSNKAIWPKKNKAVQPTKRKAQSPRGSQ